MEEIKSHYTQEAETRKKIFLAQQRMESAKFLVLCNQKPEDEKEVQEKMQEIEDLRAKLGEIQAFQGVLVEKTKEVESEKWAGLLTTLMTHEEELVGQIPAQGEVANKAADNVLSTGNVIILKLKEQIRRRDAVLDRAQKQCEQRGE